MAQLDHLIVPSRDREASATFLAELLGVEHGESIGIFSAVYVNDTLTIDFGDADEFDIHHDATRIAPVISPFDVTV